MPASEPRRFIVGPAGSLASGTSRSVVLDGRAIAIFKVGARLYALRDVCPHQGAPLSAGLVVSRLNANLPGCYEMDANHPQVRCPRHGWEYDLETGRSWYDPEHDRVRAYSAYAESGAVLVAEGAAAVAGAYLAETVPISIEEDYIVVTLS